MSNASYTDRNDLRQHKDQTLQLIIDLKINNKGLAVAQVYGIKRCQIHCYSIYSHLKSNESYK